VSPRQRQVCFCGALTGRSMTGWSAWARACGRSGNPPSTKPGDASREPSGELSGVPCPIGSLRQMMTLPLNLPSHTKGERGLASSVGCWIIPSVWMHQSDKPTGTSTMPMGKPCGRDPPTFDQRRPVRPAHSFCHQDEETGRKKSNKPVSSDRQFIAQYVPSILYIHTLPRQMSSLEPAPSLTLQPLPPQR